MGRILTKQEFQEIFNDCMECKTAFSHSHDSEGKIISEEFPIKPVCTIRDFEIGNFPDCDRDFDNFEDAWDYLQTINYFRIMSGSGSIYADNFCHSHVEGEASASSLDSPIKAGQIGSRDEGETEMEEWRD